MKILVEKETVEFLDRFLKRLEVKARIKLGFRQTESPLYVISNQHCRLCEIKFYHVEVIAVAAAVEGIFSNFVALVNNTLASQPWLRFLQSQLV